MPKLSDPKLFLGVKSACKALCPTVYFRHHLVGWGESHFLDIEGLPWCSEIKTMNGWFIHLFTCSFFYFLLESQVISKNVCSGVQTFWAPSQRKEPRRWPRRSYHSSKKSNVRGKPGEWSLKSWERLSKDRSREGCQWCWESNKIITKQCSLNLNNRKAILDLREKLL